MSLKHFHITSTLLLSMILPVILFAQGEATMMFLRIPPSPFLNGMGRTGVALLTTDPLGFYYNPALLGCSSRTTNFAFQIYPTRTDWLPSWNFSDITFNSLALNAGYKFRNKSKFTPVSVGIGYMWGQMNYNETYGHGNESEEHYHAFGAGIGFKYYLDIYFGITYKTISSSIELPIRFSYQRDIIKANAIDYGILVNIPVLEIFKNKFNTIVGLREKYKPYFNISLGYALTNFGNKVSYDFAIQSDPLPRTALLGYSITAGINIKLSKTTMTALAIDWSAEANDLLVTRDSTNFKYQGFLGDINVWKNIIKGKSDEQVEAHKGLVFHLFELIDISYGWFSGPGWDSIKTHGFGFHTRGLTRQFIDIKGWEKITEHVDLQYSWSEHTTTDSDAPFNNTQFHGITVLVYGF